MAETGRLTFAIMRAPRLRLGPVTALRIAIAATVLICWQALAASGLLYRDVVPSLLAIGRQLYLTVADPTFYFHLYTTFYEIGAAMLIGGLSGLLVGIA